MSSMRTAAAVAASLIALPAFAQDTAPENAPPPAAAATSGGGQVYTPEDFARYAPKNANDMLNQVPGFSIRENEQLRGLGQATGNVLFNGRRPSSKDDITTQLSRIPAATVTRIEILDGASLDIPGLSGQVANVVFKADALNGQFSWKPNFRPHFTDPVFTRGDISVSGRSGNLEYELGLNNDDAGNGAAGGPTLIFNGAGTVIERREEVWDTHNVAPKLSGRLTLHGAGSSLAHLNAHYQRVHSVYREDGLRTGAPGTPDRERSVRQAEDSWNYEIGGDYEFPLGPGRLKAIGLRRYSHEPFSQEVRVHPLDGSPDSGDRFAQTGNLSETIGRGEYSWKMFGGDWQLSGEAAFNSLDNVATLGTLDASGRFVNTPYPGASGKVSEDRYEALLSFGRKITDNFSFQLVAGAENSTITQTGANGLTRTFFRPKGSLSLAWAPGDGWDLALKIRRRVLQLDFYDFLARAFLNDNNTNSGNNDLRPQQDWSFEGEINKKLGPWGSTKARLVYRDVEDYVDIVPVGTGESVGNIAKSWAAAIDWTATINLDPAGLKGVKLDLRALFQKSGLRDPFTGETRQWSGFTDRVLNFTMRHDIPGTDWAYGGTIENVHVQPRYRSNSVDLNWEGPNWASFFVENKDVLGLTVRFSVSNVLNARNLRDRTVYTGLRGATPIAFVEKRDRLIGPIIGFTIRGKF